MRAAGPGAGEVSDDRLPSRTVLVGTVAWLLLVAVWLTWTPLHLAPRLNWPVLFPDTDPFELLANLLFLAPLGGVLATGTARRPLVTAVAGAALVSVAIEGGQILLIDRIASLTDVLLNTAGGAVGALAAVVLRRRVGTRRAFAAAAGVMFAGVLFVTVVGGLAVRRGIRLEAWDPTFAIVVGDEADGTKPYTGEVLEARVCAGTGATRICAGARAPLDIRRRLTAAAEESQQVELYARVRPGTDDQWGPARIVTFSESQFKRNITLGQEGTTLVLRLRTQLMGPNGKAFELWIPRAFRDGELLTVHAQYAHGAIRTELRSPSSTRVVRHTFDALSSGLLLRGAGAVTPRQMLATRLLGLLALVMPIAMLLHAALAARHSRRRHAATIPAASLLLVLSD